MDLDIYSYTNYRKLLKDYYESEKKKAPDRFSFRYFAKKAGLSSSNFFYLVMKGKRNLSYESVQKFARVLGLGRRESLFFESLVHFNQVQDPQEKHRAFEKMISFREYRASRKLLAEQYDYFSKWYYPVIRELVALADFQENPSWIAKKLGSRISREEARQALERLLELKLIIRDSDGRLQQAEPTLATDEEVASTAVLKFHNEMIEFGRLSLQQPAKEREVSAQTLSLGPIQFHQVQQKIREFHREVQQLLSENGHEKPDAVYQLNFQLFNLTHAPRRSP
jgi:uncharacterized protein (TIGR02147 family)